MKALLLAIPLWNYRFWTDIKGILMKIILKTPVESIPLFKKLHRRFDHFGRPAAGLPATGYKELMTLKVPNGLRNIPAACQQGYDSVLLFF